VPRFALGVIGATLLGFGLAEPVGVHPAWVAAAGALMLSARRLINRPVAEAARLLRAASLPFCAFVFALGVVVLAVRSTAIGTMVSRLVPGPPAGSGC
jgi:arsenical pump membrane protein